MEFLRSPIIFNCIVVLFAHGITTTGMRAGETEVKRDSRQYSDWSRTVAPDIARQFVTIRQLGIAGEQLAMGSGFQIGGGLVASCFHTVGRGNEIVAEFSDGTTRLPTEIVAWSEAADLIVLRFEVNSGLEKDQGIAFADQNIELGSPVAAMGNPEGDARYFVSGVVAAGEKVMRGVKVVPLAMAIERGNSGGPVVNQRGELVGIVALKDLRRPGLGYAISVEELKSLLKETTPVSFADWLNRHRLSESEWVPDRFRDWAKKGSVIRVENAALYPQLFRTCKAVAPSCATSTQEGAQDLTISVEVYPAAESSPGLVVSGKDGLHLGWSLRGEETLVFQVFDGGAASVRTLKAVSLPKVTRPTKWVRLKIETDGKTVRGFAEGIECAAVSLPPEMGPVSVWEAGLGLAYGRQASYRSFAKLVDPAGTKPDRPSPSRGMEITERFFPSGRDTDLTMTDLHVLELQLAEWKAKARETHSRAIQDQIVERFENSDGHGVSVESGGLVSAGLLFSSLIDPAMDPRVYQHQLNRWV
ncbi:MAG: trypsin-like peptidase domain-containing protein, partial [Verrucomicrobiales bacterium]|nr:trypsin-like peptidase domain-containing protein [Verrucomicrobiales bacterium]